MGEAIITRRGGGIDTSSIMPTISTSLVAGTNAEYISGYGAGIDNNGNLIIWAMSNNPSYEHVSFNAISIIGTKGAGWDITAFDTSEPTDIPHACVLTGLSSYKTISISIDAASANGSYDYFRMDTTVTGTT